MGKEQSYQNAAKEILRLIGGKEKCDQCSALCDKAPSGVEE